MNWDKVYPYFSWIVVDVTKDYILIEKIFVLKVYIFDLMRWDVWGYVLGIYRWWRVIDKLNKI